jgi:2-methylcitrate dehydratase PrpD
MDMKATVNKTAPASDVTRALVEHVRGFTLGSLPADVKDLARRCVLDWIAVTAAGAGDAIVKRLLDLALDEGGKPVATVVAHRARVAPLQAALINGAASHVLDYDDVNLGMNGHPSVTILPALLALAEKRDANGADIIPAFVAGYETAARVGLLVAPGHYARGYHATATIGSLAAAVACAHLLKLDPERTAVAIAIAATQAGGLKALFGTEGKPFHAGLAAQNGLRAAELSARGMIARSDVIECRQGFAAVLSPDFNTEAALGDLTRYFLRENLFKYHASCYGTHSALDAVASLRVKNKIDVQDIERVTLRVEHGADAVCNIPNPTTALQAKFSLRFMTALGLAGRDTADLALYEDTVTKEPALTALRDRVVVDLVPDRRGMQADVEIQLKDGRRLSETCDAGIPETDKAEQGRKVARKFSRLVGPLLGAKQEQALSAMVANLENTSVRELMKACAPAA